MALITRAVPAIAENVDPVTLFALVSASPRSIFHAGNTGCHPIQDGPNRLGLRCNQVSTVEALVSAGVTDPYEFYQVIAAAAYSCNPYGEPLLQL